jgi:hypothetical protein
VSSYPINRESGFAECFKSLLSRIRVFTDIYDGDSYRDKREQERSLMSDKCF